VKEQKKKKKEKMKKMLIPFARCLNLLNLYVVSWKCQYSKKKVATKWKKHFCSFEWLSETVKLEQNRTNISAQSICSLFETVEN
jgi:hypothetical protein